MLGPRLKVVGFDPSLRNWGLAVGTYDVGAKKLLVDHLDIICPALPTGKQVRQNSLDLIASNQLFMEALAAAKGAHAVFVEVPHGSQSSRAMASYGICVGVLGSLRASGVPFFEVNASEVKLATGLKKDASKKEMIAWATVNHQEANWPTYTRDGATMISEAKAEHMADAVAAIRAGIRLNGFQQMLAMMAAHT